MSFPDDVAVLGLGAMGLPMAKHLTRTFRVRGFDVDPDRRQLLEKLGGAAASDVASAVRGARVVLVAVRTLGQVEECLVASGDALAANTVFILTSTVGVDGAVWLATQLEARGVRLVDAPVSGGATRAGSGDLLVMASGDPAGIEVARPVLESLASVLVVVGASAGEGQAMKLVNQLLCGVHIAAAAEALVLAGSLGIEPSAALEVLGSGAAQSFMLADRGPRMIAHLKGEQSDVRSRLDIFVKDMGLVTEAAEASGLELPVARAAYQLFRLGEMSGLAASDDSAVSLVVRDDG